MKIAIKIILMVGIVVYAAIAILRFRKPPEEAVCEAIDITIVGKDASTIVSEEYVKYLLEQHEIQPVGRPLKETDLPFLRTMLEEDAYISQAECHYNAKSYLCISVTPLRPILHVLDDNGEDYYTDTTGVAMPVMDFNLNVCVTTGHIDKERIKEDLIPLAWFIEQDDYWRHEVTQIVVGKNGDVTLIPRQGTHRILLGSAKGFEEKLANMRLFYEKGLPVVGWNRYQVIDLRFKGQVVGRKESQVKRKKKK